MTSLIIRSTFTSAMILMALVTLAVSTAHASEITGVLNSSGGNTPTPPEQSSPTAPTLTGSVTESSGNSGGNAGGGSSTGSSTPGYAPMATNTAVAEATPAAHDTSAPGVVLNSYTDTPNAPTGDSFVEDTLPLEESYTLATLDDDYATNTQFIASAAASDSAGSISIWWWLAFSLFVISLVTGLYAYRPRHNEKSLIGAQH